VRIFYRHRGETVEVLHIWHGVRHIPALLADLDEASG
jgi:plasmid stabilization system protein ParE